MGKVKTPNSTAEEGYSRHEARSGHDSTHNVPTASRGRERERGRQRLRQRERERHRETKRN